MTISPTTVFWMSISSAMPLVGERHQRVERAFVERFPFGRALQLDEPAVAGLDEVHVDLGPRVLVVGQVEQRGAVDDAHAGGGDEVGERDIADQRQVAHPLEGERQRHEPAGDRRGARAAVRLDHVAIDPDRAFTEVRQLGDRPQRSSDQPLNLLGASADLAGRRFALRPRRGGARAACRTPP